MIFLNYTSKISNSPNSGEANQELYFDNLQCRSEVSIEKNMHHVNT
jgi:hypothetical protein